MPDEGQVSVVPASRHHAARERHPVAAPGVQFSRQRLAGSAVHRVGQGSQPAPKQAASAATGVNVSRETSLHVKGKYCSCERCRTYARQRARQLKARRARGEQIWGDVQEVRAHIEYLRSFGMAVDEIAALAGVGNSTVAKMIWEFAEHRRTERVTAPVANAILAVRFDPRRLNPKSIVDSSGARRRLQALLAAGWTVATLAQEFGVDRRNMLKLTWTPQITAGTFVRVIELFERLWPAGPPSVSKQSATRTRTMVNKYGWVGIGAWDDDTIDDPGANPNLQGEQESTVDPVKIKRVRDGHEKFKILNPAERVEMIRQWVAEGGTKTAFEVKFTVSTKTSGKYFALAVPDYQRKSA